MTDPGRFSEWQPLDAPAPAGPGILQCKIQGDLIRYPSGMSAMLHYSAGASIADLVAAFSARAAARYPAAALRWRYQALPETTARATLQQLVTRFEARFGALPVLDR
ncbi:MAG: hypothetical protein EP329_11920 [Deltaproteobacteria bacterium]|nr:MAG: hypothetical protein EP329_11920 [Deltaproteobacteria bacterium]